MTTDRDLSDTKAALRETALLFLRLGSTAFGGPAAHIAMMEDEIVKRRQWISQEHFLDLLGATNLIPGPNSTEMAIHIGYVKAGWKGLVVAGVCFIFPAVAITLLLAHLYVVFGTVPQVNSFIWGIRAAVIAVILAAVFRLSKPMVKRRFMLLVIAAVIILNLLHVDEIVLLLGAGFTGLAWASRHYMKSGLKALFSFAPLGLVPALSSLGMSGLQTYPITLTALGLYFLKIGSILYGSGYVLIAFLQRGLVETRHWLTQPQLLDAIAIGQFTPGPVLSTASFIGYVILGWPGAFISTAGIFLPSFVFVLIIGPFVPALRKSPLMSGFLDGVNAAALGLMVSVSITLGLSTLTSAGAWIILAVSATALLVWNLHPAWIVAGSAVAGSILTAYQ